jgi:hypothetical protein
MLICKYHTYHIFLSNTFLNFIKNDSIVGDGLLCREPAKDWSRSLRFWVVFEYIKIIFREESTICSNSSEYRRLFEVLSNELLREPNGDIYTIL